MADVIRTSVRQRFGHPRQHRPGGPHLVMENARYPAHRQTPLVANPEAMDAPCQWP
jgi:hypothetical protein